MITARNIYKKYDKAENYAVKNFSYQFPDHGFYILTGPSGAGKTTLLGVLAGVDEKYEGHVYYDNVELNSKNRLNYRNHISTIVFQDLNLISYLNVEDNLRIAYEIAGQRYDKEQLVDDLRKVNLPDKNESINHFLGKKIRELSGGQKQRIAIARALIRKSKVLFMDEPTAALDEKNSKEIALLLESISKDVLVIIATHSPQYFSFEHTVSLHIENGIILESEDVGEIIQSLDNASFQKPNPISFYSSRKLSFSIFSRSKFKYIVSLLLCFISLTAFSYFSNIRTIKSDETILRTQIKYGNSICLFTGSNSFVDSETGDDVYENHFTPQQQEILKSYNAHELFDFKISVHSDPDKVTDESYLSIKYIEQNRYSYLVMPLWDEHSNQFIQDERIKSNPNAHFPKKVDEVAISSIMADYLINYSSDYGNLKDVNDLIGKELKIFTICNIYSTSDEIETDKFRTTSKNEEDPTFKDLDMMSDDESYSLFLYACPTFPEEYQNLPPLYTDQPSDEDIDSDQDIFFPGYDEDDEDTYIINPSNKKYYAFDCKKDYGKAIQLRNDLLSVKDDSIQRNYSVGCLNLYNYRYTLGYLVEDGQGSRLIFYFILLMIIISAIALLNLFMTNVRKETYTYGILNALGCSKRGLCKTQAVSSLFIISLLFLSVSIVTEIGCIILNKASRLVCLTFNPLIFFETLGIIILISLLTSFFSCIKAIKTNPKILLNDKD